MKSTRPAAAVVARPNPTALHTAPLVAALVVMTALCAPGYEGAPTGQTVERGLWGGDHMSLDVTSAGADADFDCAHGAISQAITLDRSGRFDAAGTYTPESPGPQREGQGGQPQVARYTGRVRGSTMTVTIAIAGGGETLGPFTLTRGAPPRVVKCR